MRRGKRNVRFGMIRGNLNSWTGHKVRAVSLMHGYSRPLFQQREQPGALVNQRNVPDPTYTVIDDTFITLADGRRLAARMWMPDSAMSDGGVNPVPAIVEYIPYRKRDGTAARDESVYPAFAAAGYAGIRVDRAGHGESDGEFDDEYSPAELADGVEVIAWIAAQPWCSGAVGMMGISWGGFNALQIAALRPPALRAIISIGSTVDRYNDDIHYKNGCQLYSNVSWSSNMLCYAARAPDPMLVGGRWRDMWLNRLATQPFPLSTWLKHQRRDEFWRHGSISDDYAAIQVPTLIMSGWCDGYVNAPPAAAANLTTPTKAVNGPWIHKYPHFAWPKPRMDFQGEALRWWDRWLKEIRNDAESLPAYRAFISEAVRPQPRREHEAGRWVGEQHWPSPHIKPRSWYLTAGNELSMQPGDGTRTSVCSPQDCGIAAGEFFTLKPEGELPADQRIDDAGSLTFFTPVLNEPLDVLGRPNLTLRVSIDAPLGNLAVRLVDVHPDGVSQRVSFGALNLAHRNSNAEPAQMPAEEFQTIHLALDECGYRFRAGHRLGICISTSYWPWLHPCPYKTTATFDLDKDCSLELPVRTGDDEIDVAQPEDPNPLPEYVVHLPGEERRWVERDLGTHTTHYHVLTDTGDAEQPEHGLIWGERREDCYSINAEDPLSARFDCRYSHRTRRGDWSVRVETRTRMSCDAHHFHLRAEVQAYEDGERVHERHWEESIPRDLM